MKLPNIGTPVGPAIWVRRWYDRTSRNWIVQKLDTNENQIGDAATAGTKAGADAYVKQFRSEIEEAKKEKPE